MDGCLPADTPNAMIRDLRTILDGWGFEQGKVSVRKIIGRDGREKIQTRIDLGVLQLECTGRPDGARPCGCESLLAYHERRLQEHIEIYGDDEDFVLSPEDCRDLRHEAYLYYQRFLSLYVLEEYEGVVEDTVRNLRVIDLSDRYAATERDRAMLAPQRAYVMMMHTRAMAQLALGRDSAETALRAIEAGVAELESRVGDEEEGDPYLDEARTLRELRVEILEALPEDSPIRLRSELEAAIACEDYERAAELRDRLASQRNCTSGV